MTSPLYPTFHKRINDATEQIIKRQVTPWSFLTTGHPFRVKMFDGQQISYEGIGFEGSPRTVFWSRYIEPFLEDLCVSEIGAAVTLAKEKALMDDSFFRNFRLCFPLGVVEFIRSWQMWIDDYAEEAIPTR